MHNSKRPSPVVKKDQSTRLPIKVEKSKTKPISELPKTNRDKKRLKRKKILKITLITIFILLILSIIATVGLFAWVSKDLPDPDKLSERFLAQSTIIYDKTGQNILYETGKDVKRTSIGINDINDYVKWSTISLEDQAFYQHSGFQLKSFIRAVYRKITTGSASATSTLTQQFIKNAIVGSDRTYTRKLKEIILAIQLERKYSKDEILMMYLNEVGYGGINYGVAAAANSYFGKNAKDLSLAEAATLAGLVQRPTYFMSNQDSLKWRRDYCIDQMLKDGYINQEEAEIAKTEPLALAKEKVYKKAPHFVDYVISKLEDDYGSSFINQGFKVITTLDWDKQQIAEQVISENMDIIKNRGGSNAALVSLDAHTGQILAMVGSYDYYATDYDGQVNVTISDRQPGSSFKPLAYYTAFTKGYTPNTVLYDIVTNFPTATGSYTPHNYSGGQAGPVSMKYALGQSLNIPAVKTLYLAGINNVLDSADSLGYSTLKDRERYGLALVLGGGDVKLLEHTSAFATFAREGERHAVVSILKVEDQKGNILYEWQDQPTQALDKAATQTLNQVLSDPANHTGFNALNINGHTVAAKTGTTQEYKDAWTMGYTPSFATGVWVGNNDATTMNPGSAGLIVAAPIWNSYMSKILSGLPDETFNAPPPTNPTKAVLWGEKGKSITKKVDKFTKKIIPDECLASYPAEYLEDKEFKEYHNILYYLSKENPNDTTTIGKDDAMFNAWEAPVIEWAKTQPDALTEDAEYENCSLRDESQKPTITITSPTKNMELNSKNFLISVDTTVGNQRSVAKIVYTIDVTVVSQATASPFNSTYIPTDLSSGKHTLTATVYDNFGDSSSSSVKFNYTAKKKKAS
ncbi:MAG: transglycosylase domain-containing protein [Patescibacteria group bacterium]